MLLRDILREDASPVRHYDLSQIHQRLGVKWLDVDYTFTQEELANMKEQGILVPSFGSKYGDQDTPQVPILYSHVVEQNDNEGLLHAIKMRDPLHRIPPDLIKQMISDSVSAITGKKSITKTDGMKGAGGKQRALEIAQAAMAKYKPIIIPMPSSSPLTMMFARELANQIGSSVGDLLVKHPFPEKSKQVRTKSRGFEPADDTTPSPADRQRSNNNALEKINAELERLYNQDLTDDSLERIEQLELKQSQLKKAVDPSQNKFEKKSLQSMFGSSRRYYDYIRHKESASHIHEKHIILVDDNIVTGETLAEAIKSFVRQGISPKVDACICIHNYI